jgi:hypothetical protein
MRICNDENGITATEMMIEMGGWLGNPRTTRRFMIAETIEVHAELSNAAFDYPRVSMNSDAAQ